MGISSLRCGGDIEPEVRKSSLRCSGDIEHALRISILRCGYPSCGAVRRFSLLCGAKLIQGLILGIELQTQSFATGDAERLLTI
jgi:hypothetical protein